jgi:hypothetical protein
VALRALPPSHAGGSTSVAFPATAFSSDETFGDTAGSLVTAEECMRLNELNARSMNSDRIAEVLRPLAVLFNEPVHFSRVNRRGKWADEVIGR